MSFHKYFCRRRAQTRCHYVVNAELSPSKVGLGLYALLRLFRNLSVMHFILQQALRCLHCFPLPLIPLSAKTVKTVIMIHRVGGHISKVM